MSETTVVTDGGGRKITLRTLDPGDMLDLLEAAGEQSGNAGFMQYACIVAAVSDIDGVPLLKATRKDKLKANARLLGNAGIVAVSRELFGNAAEAAPEPAEEHPAKN